MDRWKDNRFEWCEDCKRIDSGGVKEFCNKHFIPNRNSVGYVKNNKSYVTELGGGE